MDDHVTIFNEENMLSILGIEINDDFDVEFFREDLWNDFTSSFSIISKNHQSHSLSVNNNETNNKISSILEFEPILSADGIVTSLVPMNNPKIKSAMNLINQYIKVFMAIYTVDEFNKHDSFMLKLIFDYNNDLEIINVTSTTDLFKFYSWHHDLIEIEIESYVNNLLNQVGIQSLNEESNIEQAIELLKMQEMVYEMDLI